MRSKVAILMEIQQYRSPGLILKAWQEPLGTPCMPGSGHEQKLSHLFTAWEEKDPVEEDLLPGLPSPTR